MDIKIGELTPAQKKVFKKLGKMQTEALILQGRHRVGLEALWNELDREYTLPKGVYISNGVIYQYEPL
ncbi:hypothetical protein LCGC14_0369780 [marine sediment metagenome]|uniref:Uncharacterized protein n=1 Tax=marine sediment metagenome TaxID=412755 RepID=A0A0F9TBB9_9ZZZZ